ncbi:hypothetical protein PAPHI01_2005 [Pancytospora philotis]|nr:hypothetical protein PAPHI01_2005 [Pancytospora philotis]
MKIDYLLAVFLALFVAFFSAVSPAIIPTEEGESASFLTHRCEELTTTAIPEAQEQAKAAKEDRFGKFLYQCYYRGQPVRPKSGRTNGARSSLYGVCDKEALTRDIIPKRGRRHHHYGRRSRHADKEGLEATTPENNESNYDEIRDGIYSVLTKARYAPPRTYAKADSASAEAMHPTFSAAELASVVHGDNDLVSLMYDRLVEHEPMDFAAIQPILNTTYFGRFYLKSRSFEHFLSTWKKTDDNARYHITQADVDEVRKEVRNGMRFRWISNAQKQLFGKLLFVRNTLEAYAMIREVMEPLGLETREHRTAEDFLQAVYGYLMAVHKSDGSLVVESSVGLSVFASQLLSLAYARCGPSKLYSVVDGKEVALDDFLDKEAHLYVEGMIVLFKAWFKADKDYLDPAVLAEVTDDVYSYVKPSGDYEDGCQELARD